jgi:asparagine synthase (glutamine-hydrolysing)
MCGIAGIVYDDSERRVDRAALERMCHQIVHRGPDDRGIWESPGVGLGHQRLSVIDLSPAGHQPMSNEDGSVWVTYNGEIYNFAELRAELESRGHQFRSRTDTEVLVHLYEELGDGLVERLDGMFAFGLWDVRRRRLLLARDRVGQKPLKYAELPGGLVFASELKAILASGLVEPDVDLEAIDRFLCLSYVPAPGTGLRGIQKLPAGHLLVRENGETRIERYWSLDYRDKQSRTSDEWTEAVRSEVRAAVDRRLISDVPLGAFLSGGIDSSIVVACMAESGSRPVETFSIGFEHEAYNELPHARAIAERYGTSHHEFVVRADDAELLPRLARHYEEPYSDPSALPSYFLARETRRHVTVALNGDGGDEGFTGYQRYAQARAWDARSWLGQLGLGSAARLTAGAVAGVSSDLARRLDAFAHLSSPALARRYGWLMRLLSDRERARLYTPEMQAHLEASAAQILGSWTDDPRAGTETFDRLCYADVRGYLADELMTKMDLASMAHSLEARSPLLDHRVLELAASAPADIRCPGGSLKGLLKRAFRDVFPAELLERPKRGFALPLHDWFRGPLRPLAEELLLSEQTRIRRYLHGPALSTLVREHMEGRAQRGVLLWALSMLELWHRELVEWRS